MRAPTPEIWASSPSEPGSRSAIAVSVASVKTTYAGTLASLATASRQARSFSNVPSAYVGGQSSHRPVVRCDAVVSSVLNVRRRNADLAAGLTVGFAGCLTTILGSLVAGWIDARAGSIVFAVFLLLVAVQMTLRLLRRR